MTKQQWEEAKNNFLLQQVDSFLNLNNINPDSSTLWDVDSKGSISLDLKEEEKAESLPIVDKPKIKKKWWRFW